MTLGKMLAQFGSKDIAERVNTEYHASPGQTQHLFYSYDPTAHVHAHATSKHHYGFSHGKKNNAAMSALTLLAFLFFLHILQQCLREHMQGMATPQIMIMSAAREDDLPHLKKMDKTGPQKEPRKDKETKTEEPPENEMTRIKTAQFKPKTQTKYLSTAQRYRNITYPDFN